MWSPDGRWFVSGDQGGMVLIWDPYKKKVSSATNDKSSEDPATSSDRQRSKNPVAHSLLVSKIKAHSKHITSMAFEPMHRIYHLHRGEKKVCERFVTASKDGIAKIWNVRTRQCEATLSGHLDGIECVKWFVP
jgi:ribosome assembly protein 4